MVSDSEDSYSGSSHGREKSKVQGFTPLTPSQLWLINEQNEERESPIVPQWDD